MEIPLEPQTHQGVAAMAEMYKARVFTCAQPSSPTEDKSQSVFKIYLRVFV